MLAVVLKLGSLEFDTGARQMLVAGKPWLLSARETAVLEVLMHRPGHVVSKQVVEDQLFGLDHEVGSNAVEVYVHRLRKQLAEAGATVLIHTVRGVGYFIAEQ
jgi:DNA-binding response OmpR family regulator